MADLDTTSHDNAMGIALGLMAIGAKSAHFEHTRGFIDTLDSHGGPMHKAAAAAVAQIYREIGQEESFSGLLFAKLATADWHPEFAVFMDAAYEVLGAEQIKQAGLGKIIGVDLVGKLFESGGQLIPEAALTAAALSSVVGGGAGALNWQLQRSIGQDDAPNEALKSKTLEYKRVASEIDNNLRLKGITPHGALPAQ